MRLVRENLDRFSVIWIRSIVIGYHWHIRDGKYDGFDRLLRTYILRVWE